MGVYITNLIVRKSLCYITTPIILLYRVIENLLILKHENNDVTLCQSTNNRKKKNIKDC